MTQRFAWPATAALLDDVPVHGMTLFAGNYVIISVLGTALILALAWLGTVAIRRLTDLGMELSVPLLMIAILAPSL
ncbi:MAG: hypothetical protein AAFX02_10645, partial [Pseudomonadota bacterium]